MLKGSGRKSTGNLYSSKSTVISLKCQLQIKKLVWNNTYVEYFSTAT